MQFVILSLGSRNNVKFGRAGDMVCCFHDIDDCLPASIRSLVRWMFCRAGPSDALNRANCHFLRIYYRGMGNVRHHSVSTRFPVLTAYRVPRPSKNANATPTKARQRGPRARPSRTRRRKTLSAWSVSSPLCVSLFPSTMVILNDLFAVGDYQGTGVRCYISFRSA